MGCSPPTTTDKILNWICWIWEKKFIIAYVLFTAGVVCFFFFLLFTAIIEPLDKLSTSPAKTNNDVLHLYVMKNNEVVEYVAVDRELQIPGELPSKTCPQIGGSIVAHQTIPSEYKQYGFILSTVRLKHLDEKLGLVEKKEGG